MAEEARETLDLSARGLKKVDPATVEARAVSVLILDHNELQRLDNLETYNRVEHLSASNNLVLRMHGVSKLSNLRVLCLNNNGILQIEGLKEMTYLKTLKLAGNNIKSIEHLNHNTHLEHLDLSNNQVSYVADISYLRSLKYLSLERNRLVDLRQCERYLPSSLQHLGLANNNIEDLNEVSHLVHLGKLESFTVQGNPCVHMAGKDKMGFDYRPFILNWIMSVKSIDGFVVTAIESLKAEWLYSQGKGRAYRSGQHVDLCSYLASTCPLTADALESEDQRKLRIILSKAQHHQMQLKDQSNSPNKSKLQSPRMQSRISTRNVGRSPDRLSMSYHSAMTKTNQLSNQNAMSMSCSGDITSDAGIAAVPVAMCQSYDSPGLMFAAGDKGNIPQSESVANGKEAKIALIPEPQPASKAVNQPLEAASKMVPVPESLMSPDYQDPMFDLQRNISKVSRSTLNTSNSSQSSSSSPRESHESERVTKTVHQMNMTNAGRKKGSPKLTRSAMSSPKLRSKADQRKGSLSKLDIKSMSDSNESINRNLNGTPVTNALMNKPMNKNSPIVEAEIQEKLQGIKAASQRRQSRATNDASVRAAVTIQKMWRGYRSRNLHKETLRILHAIQAARARQHIQRLTCDMEATKAALDSERKIQQLQMQAINALWKKVSALQSAGESKSNSSESEENNGTMRQLTETCYSLQTQVVELQSCMQEVVRAVSSLRPHPGAPAPVATQTDITAVVTPQEERCGWLRRPQSLALAVPSAPAPALPLPPPPSHADEQKSAPALPLPPPPSHADVQRSAPALPLPPPPSHADVQRGDQATDTEQEVSLTLDSISAPEPEERSEGEVPAQTPTASCEVLQHVPAETD